MNCSAWRCRHKGDQKCGSIDTNIKTDTFEQTVEVFLCGQCLTDMLEEVQ